MIAAIFDMDGVLVDNYDYHKKSWEIFCSKHNVEISQDQLKNYCFGRTNEVTLPLLFGRQLSKIEIESLSDEKELIYRQIYENEIHPVDGLIPFLKDLKNAGFKIALATSGPRINADFVLKSTSIDSFFDVVVSSNDISKGKPDPEIYIKAVKLLNINPSNCIVFEDSYPGIESGRAAGMKVIGLATTHKTTHLKNTEITINNYNELKVNELIELLA